MDPGSNSSTCDIGSSKRGGRPVSTGNAVDQLRLWRSTSLSLSLSLILHVTITSPCGAGITLPRSRSCEFSSILECVSAVPEEFSPGTVITTLDRWLSILSCPVTV